MKHLIVFVLFLLPTVRMIIHPALLYAKVPPQTSQPDSWHRIDSGRLTWYGEGWVVKDHFCIRVDTTHAFFYANDEYDQLLHSMVTEPAPGMLHFSGTYDRSKFPVGSVFTVRDPVRDEVGAFLVNSKNIQWKNVSMHYMHGLGIVAQFSENISMDKVFIEPAPGSGRMIASFADGMHFSCCKGLVSVDSCRFDGMHEGRSPLRSINMLWSKPPDGYPQGKFSSLLPGRSPGKSGSQM